MADEVKIGFPFRPDIEEDMKVFYNSLNKKDQRHYAAIVITSASDNFGSNPLGLNLPVISFLSSTFTK